MADYKISIITICHNEASSISMTLKSVINQSFKNYEYIVIDGASTDGTVNIIRSYEKYIDYWVSEKDTGIYEAMNKGIRQAHGVIFIFFVMEEIFLLALMFLKKLFQPRETKIFSMAIS